MVPMTGMVLSSRVMVGAGLAPALVFPSIRLSIAFASSIRIEVTNVCPRPSFCVQTTIRSFRVYVERDSGRSAEDNR